MRRYIRNIATWLWRGVNVIAGWLSEGVNTMILLGEPEESVCQRAANSDAPWALLFCRWVDRVAKGHCAERRKSDRRKG